MKTLLYILVIVSALCGRPSEASDLNQFLMNALRPQNTGFLPTYPVPSPPPLSIQMNPQVLSLLNSLSLPRGQDAFFQGNPPSQQLLPIQQGLQPSSLSPALSMSGTPNLFRAPARPITQVEVQQKRISPAVNATPAVSIPTSSSSSILVSRTSSPPIDLTEEDEASPSVSSRATPVPALRKSIDPKNKMEYYFAVIRNNMELISDSTKKPRFDIPSKQERKKVARALRVSVDVLERELEKDRAERDSGKAPLLFPQEVVEELETRLNAAMENRSKSESDLFNLLTIAEIANGIYVDNWIDTNTISFIVARNEGILLDSKHKPIFDISSDEIEDTAQELGIGVAALKARLDAGQRYRAAGLPDNFFPERAEKQWKDHFRKLQERNLDGLQEEVINYIKIGERLEVEYLKVRESEEKEHKASNLTTGPVQPSNSSSSSAANLTAQVRIRRKAATGPTHSDDKHECNKCHRKFVYKGNLQNHLVTNNGKVFECKKCLLKFPDKCAIVSHDRTEHYKKRKPILTSDSQNANESRDSNSSNKRLKETQTEATTAAAVSAPALALGSLTQLSIPTVPCQMPAPRWLVPSDDPFDPDLDQYNEDSNELNMSNVSTDSSSSTSSNPTLGDCSETDSHISDDPTLFL